MTAVVLRCVPSYVSDAPAAAFSAHDMRLLRTSGSIDAVSRCLPKGIVVQAPKQVGTVS